MASNEQLTQLRNGLSESFNAFLQALPSVLEPLKEGSPENAADIDAAYKKLGDAVTRLDSLVGRSIKSITNKSDEIT